MTNLTEQRIESGKKATLTSIETDLNNDNWDALYYASEDQISKLIDQNRIDEDFYSRWDNYQEDLRCMMAELG